MNPKLPEALQLAIYKPGNGFELGACVKQIQDYEPAGLRIWNADHLAMLSPVISLGLLSVLLCYYRASHSLTQSEFFINSGRFLPLVTESSHVNKASCI